jgi:hypothetical protein
MTGVVNVLPVPRLDPPVEAAYQFIVPKLAVAPRITVPLTHVLPVVVLIIEGADVTVTVLVEVEVHPKPLVTVTV